MLKTLILKGDEIKTYKNGVANVCQPDLFYRVYITGFPLHRLVLTLLHLAQVVYLKILAPVHVAETIRNGGNNITSTDLTTLCPGAYTFEVFYAIPGSFSGGGSTVYDSNGGNNYVANFTVTSNLQLTASSNSTLCTGNTLNLNTSITGYYLRRCDLLRKLFHFLKTRMFHLPILPVPTRREALQSPHQSIVNPYLK